MTRFLVLLGLLGPAVLPPPAGARGADDAPVKAKARELKRLEGTWIVVRHYFWQQEQKGRLVGKKLRFEGDTLTYAGRKGIFTIDPGTRPKQLTMRYVDDATKKEMALNCIYMFDDDQLIIEHRWGFGEELARPSEFGVGQNTFLRLERDKD